jgi:hypothetical protein
MLFSSYNNMYFWRFWVIRSLLEWVRVEWAQAPNEIAHRAKHIQPSLTLQRDNGAARTIGGNKETSSSLEVLVETSVTLSGNGALPDIEKHRAGTPRSWNSSIH